MKELELAAPPSPDITITSLDMQRGLPVTVLDRLSIMSADDWEIFTLEIVHYWKGMYRKVTKCGGGGDMGRDVIAYTESGWENYQCKRYKDKLSVAEAILEVGKVVYYTFNGEYSLPEKYYFVSPKGCGTELIKALQDPAKLKSELIRRWDAVCADKITRSKRVELDASLSLFVEGMDFSIFDDVPPLKLVELHSNTPFHGFRFGTYKKARPITPKPPETIAVTELVYTQALMDAFSENKNTLIDSSNLHLHPEFGDELKSARKNFYAAESLERFSRDWIPDEHSFDDLKEECHEAIRATVSQHHSDGFARYLKTCEVSALIVYESHPLSPFMKIQDKKGLCHHIVNDQVFKWVRK